LIDLSFTANGREASQSQDPFTRSHHHSLLVETREENRVSTSAHRLLNEYKYTTRKKNGTTPLLFQRSDARQGPASFPVARWKRTLIIEKSGGAEHCIHVK